MGKFLKYLLTVMQEKGYVGKQVPAMMGGAFF